MPQHGERRRLDPAVAPVGEAVGVLCEAFPEIDAARIEGDVSALFADLAERGLLVAAPV